jgi:hypothetical protein
MKRSSLKKSDFSPKMFYGLALDAICAF